MVSVVFLTYSLLLRFSIISLMLQMRHCAVSNLNPQSYFTPQKLATAAENFQMEHQWKDEFEVTEGHKNANMSHVLRTVSVSFMCVY